MKKFRICTISPSGSLELSPITISPEAAWRRDPVAFRELYEEMRRVVDRESRPKQLELMSDARI